MDAPVQPAASVTDPLGVIIVDHDCKRCGYNLRGLNISSRCPECGTPIGLSVQGDLLRFSDPDWVEKVARGLTIILWMILAAIIAGIVAAIAGAIGGLALKPVLTFAIGLVSFYGVWLMTEPDPSGVGEDPNIGARKLVRISLVVGLVGQLPTLADDSLPFPYPLDVVLAIGAGLAVLVGVVGEFAKFIYYEKLALRIPDKALADRARFLRWACTISLGVVLVGALLAAVVAATAGPGALMPLACVAIVGLLALIVFGVMTLFLLLRLRTRIIEQARNARLT